jgi:hypothetical protein
MGQARSPFIRARSSRASIAATPVSSSPALADVAVEAPRSGLNCGFRSTCQKFASTSVDALPPAGGLDSTDHCAVRDGNVLDRDLLLGRAAVTFERIEEHRVIP